MIMIYTYLYAIVIFFAGFMSSQFDHSMYDFISCLMFLFMKCSMYVVDEISAIFILFMVYFSCVRSQSFTVHDLVLVLACQVYTFLLINFKTKIIKNQFHFVLFSRLCQLVLVVVQEQFLAQTSLASLSGMKIKYIFLGLLSFN